MDHHFLIEDSATGRRWDERLPLTPHEKPLQSPLGSGWEQYYVVENRRQGECRAFYGDGTLQSLSHYEGGFLHGPVSYWSPSGQLIAKSSYVRGKKCGPYQLWYSSSALYSEQHYVDGERAGPQLYYYENGALRTRMHYVDGIIEGLVEQFYEEGSVKRRTSYELGLRSGEDRLFSKSSLPLMQATYLKGVPVGQLQLFHDNGQLSELYTYSTLPWRFDVERWDRSGSLWQEGKSLPDGSFEEKSYDDQGRLIRHEVAHRSDTGETLSVKSLPIAVVASIPT